MRGCPKNQARSAQMIRWHLPQLSSLYAHSKLYRGIESMDKSVLCSRQEIHLHWLRITLSPLHCFSRTPLHAVRKRLTRFRASLRSFGSGSLLKLSPRPISAGPLHPLPDFHSQPIYLVFSEGSYFFRMRHFISGRASRLDAFSAYPFRTQLPSCAPGGTTGSPWVRPLRSSRTRSSLPHVSSARDGYGPNCLTTF